MQLARGGPHPMARGALNRYLVTPSGVFVGTRARATVIFFGGLALSIVIGVVGGVAGAFLELAVITALAILVAVGLFVATVVAQWVFLLGGAKSVERATHIFMSGDTQAPLTLCHKPLATVFRADVRTRALYVLGLCAEANGDFAEAADLFDRASQMVPAFAAGKWQRHARVLMLSHRAVALVALARLDEADAIIRQASLLFPPRAPGALDALTDDVAFGAVGLAAALRDLEPGRDPRALLTLASVTVLAARGMAREAVELVERERYTLNAGLLPRERALVARVEARARGLFGGGPMRAPGVASQGGPADPAGDAWAERVLPL